MIDHLVYATPDLDAAVEWVAAALGVRPTPGGRHPGLGTSNALLDLGGGAYLEIIGVDGSVEPAAAGPRPFGLDDIAGPRLAAWAAKADGIDQRVARARRFGYDPGPVQPLSRRLPDGTELRWRLTVPGADSVELVPFLIEWADDAPHPSTTSAAGCRLVSFTGAHPQPDAVAPLLRALGVELDVHPSSSPALLAVIEGPDGTVRLS
ncbi:MAG: VOC family protein [Actinobacteria bacterium]|nr:VOC family protein [Actinomycetota bacterium]